MFRNFVILDSAKEELKDIQKYIKKNFGDLIWNEVNFEYRDAFKFIKHNPDSGGSIEELKNLGITNVKYKLVRQTRVVYEFDNELILVHMFISTKRDFGNHLMKRILD